MEISIREATSDDIPETLRQRRGMYQDMGYEDEAALGKMVSVCEPCRFVAGWLSARRESLAVEESSSVRG